MTDKIEPIEKAKPQEPGSTDTDTGKDQEPDSASPSFLASRASSLLSLPLKAAVIVRLANEPPLPASPENRVRFTLPLPFIAPGWSKGNDVAAAHIRHGNLEVMQWIAFAAMVIDHIGFMMPYWGLGDANILRGIGRISFPMFSFVFAWRLASTLWSNPRHNFSDMLFKLVCCALAAHIAWAATGTETQINIVVSLGGALGIVLLLQEDRGWSLPLGLRLAVAAAIGYWISLKVDYGMPGLVLTLATYSYLRFNDIGARNTALAALFVLTAGFHVHTAILALPVIFLVHNTNWSVGKIFKSFFYVMYPLHVIALAAITTLFFV